MQIIYIIGIFEALFLFAFILSKKQRTAADSILAVSFLLFGLNILTAYLEWQNRINGYPFPFFIQTTPPIILLHGPVLWFYIKAQTEQNFRFRAIHLLHFLPCLLLITDFSFNIYSLPETTRIQLDSTEAFKKFPTFGIGMAAILVSTPTYYTWGLLLLRRYRKRIKNYFSEISKVDLRWLQVLLISSLILSGIIDSTFCVDQFIAIASFGVLQAGSFSFVSVYVLFLGFFGHRQEALITKVPLKSILIEEPVQPDKSIANVDEAFIYRLLDWMKVQKPYLEPNLTISALSEQLNVSEEYLSAILNNKLSRNFFDFVNQYRVDEFKTRCLDPQNEKLTLIAIAFDCGFNSKATFNRVFKNYTGFTPSAYKQSISEK
jgi:AraC-like DNA-binding protein